MSTPADTTQTTTQTQTPPATTPAAETQKTETKAPAPISESLQAILKDRMRGKVTPPQKTETKTDAPKTEEKPAEKPAETKVEDAKPAEKPATEAKPDNKVTAPKVAKPRAKVDTGAAIRAAETAAEAARAAVELASRKHEPARDVTFAQPELPPEYAKELPILKQMESMWPDKYKGITDRYTKSAGELDRYRREWMRQNPGKDWNVDDEDHNAFFDRNVVDWDDQQYRQAEIALAAKPLIEAEKASTNKKLEELETRELVRELQPVIAKQQAVAAREVLSGIDKELAALVDAAGELNEAEVQKQMDADPIRTRAALEAAQEVAVFAGEVVRIFHPSGKFGFDQRNPAHSDIAQFISREEAKIRELPEEDQLDSQGRRFATREDYARMPEHRRNLYYCLEPGDLVFLKTVRVRQQTARKIEESTKEIESLAEKIARRKGWIKDDGAKSEPPKKEEKKPETKPAAAAAASPSVTEGMKVDTGATTANNTPTDFRAALKARLRGGSVS